MHNGTEETRHERSKEGEKCQFLCLINNLNTFVYFDGASTQEKYSTSVKVRNNKTSTNTFQDVLYFLLYTRVNKRE